MNEQEKALQQYTTFRFCNAREMPHFMVQAREEGLLEDILTDFAQAQSVAGDRVRIGRYYAFGRGIDLAFDLRHYRILKEDKDTDHSLFALRTIYFFSGGSGYPLCRIPKGAKGDCVLEEVADALRSRVPDLKVYTKKGGKFL